MTERTITLVEGTKEDILALVAMMQILDQVPVEGHPSFEEQIATSTQKIFPIQFVEPLSSQPTAKGEQWVHVTDLF